jgi:hypothetical protein
MVTPNAIAEGRATSIAANPPQMSPDKYFLSIAMVALIIFPLIIRYSLYLTTQAYIN